MEVSLRTRAQHVKKLADLEEMAGRYLVLAGPELVPHVIESDAVF
jgi:hypothetical protein